MKFLNNLTFRGSSAVEQLTVNQLVAGSNPAPGAKKKPLQIAKVFSWLPLLNEIRTARP